MWLKCSERMPEFYYACVAVDGSGEMVIGTPDSLTEGERKAFRMSNGELFVATHWIPLPEPPED